MRQDSPILVGHGLAAIATDRVMIPTHGSPSCSPFFTTLIPMHSRGSVLIYNMCAHGHRVLTFFRGMMSWLNAPTTTLNVN
jgi:hypothetical protein